MFESKLFLKSPSVDFFHATDSKIGAGWALSLEFMNLLYFFKVFCVAFGLDL